MGEPWQTILRAAIIIGIAVFMWSVSTSMEQIAKALTRLADSREGRSGGTGDGPPESDRSGGA